MQDLLQACDDVDIGKVQQLLRARTNVDCQDEVRMYCTVNTYMYKTVRVYMYILCTKTV